MQQLFIQFINYVWSLLHVSALHCYLQGALLVSSERCLIEEPSIEYCGWTCCVRRHWELSLRMAMKCRNMQEPPYIINKLNKQLLHLLIFHAYIDGMHGSRSKIPSKKSRQAALRGWI
jgi:hypothetical protein